MTTAPERLRRFARPIVIAAVAVTLTLLLLYSRPLRSAILDPLVWLLNDIRGSLAALPQALLWGIGLLIGCFALGVSWKRVLDGLKDRPKRARWAPVRPHNALAIEELARALRRSPKRHVSRVRVVRELTVLAVRLIAQRRGVSLDEARRLLNSGEWPDDPRVRRLFAIRRAGWGGRSKQRFLDAVQHATAYLERYHQEV
jgi:hypothetical protein